MGRFFLWQLHPHLAIANLLASRLSADTGKLYQFIGYYFEWELKIGFCGF